MLHSLRRGTQAIGYWTGLAGNAARDDGRARILMLHGTPRRHAALLERLLLYVRRHFDVVPLGALAAQLTTGLPFRRQLAITFDDGLRSNTAIAYPILRRLGLKATFFVCPALVDRRGWLWNHEARQRLRRLPQAPLGQIAEAAGCAPDVEAIVERMKRARSAQRRIVALRIESATPDFRATAEEREAYDLATWEMLRSLDPQVVEVGSHTLTHAILPTLEDDELAHELRESRRLLEERLDRPAAAFAFPNGDFDSRSSALVERVYSCAVTVENGPVNPGSSEHRLPRINVPWSALRFALAMHSPGSAPRRAAGA